MKKILYVGPSWAVRSFTNYIETDPNGGTNLAKELGLDVVNLSKFGQSNMQCLDRVRSYKEPFDGVLWIYCEPILDVLGEDRKNLVESDSFWTQRADINRSILASINQLGCPIGIIGGHSDINDCDFPNITVIHPSWQKFLADQTGVVLEHGWGAEVAQRYFAHEFKNSCPSKDIVFKISDTLRSWAQLEQAGVFTWAHPNPKGNELFAKEIANSVQSFINNL